MAVYTQDTGVLIEFETNVTGINEAKLYMLKPDNNKVEIDCDINDNVVSITTDSTTLDIAGTYMLQPYIETDTFKGRGQPVKLEVKQGI